MTQEGSTNDRRHSYGATESSNISVSSMEKYHINTELHIAPEIVDTQAPIDLSTPEAQAALDKLYRKLDWRIIPPLWVLYFPDIHGKFPLW